MTGQVVAVLGSVRIDGEVGDQVVAVLGTVELGPHAVVHGDVVTVGGRLRRAPGAQVARRRDRSVARGHWGTVSTVPWMRGWGPFHFGGFGPVTRLVGTTFRFVLLALIACLALVVARRAVEGSAQRVTDEPVRSTLIGLVAWVLFVPMFALIAIVLAISFIGIPLLLLVPFAVLFLLLMAVVGFSGTASAVGQWARRRFGIGTPVGVCRRVPRDPDHSPAGAARPSSWRSGAGRSVRSRSCSWRRVWPWSSSPGPAGSAPSSSMRSRGGRPRAARGHSVPRRVTP